MRIKEKERMASMFYELNIGDVFRDKCGTICMKIDNYDAKLHGDTGKLYKLNAVSLKNTELRLFDDTSIVYLMKGSFVEE